MARPAPCTLLQEITAALLANRRDQAVALFFGKGMGIPAPGVVFMRLLMPAWSDQSGKPLPADRWSPATSPVMVAVGAKSEPFFHSGAKALAGKLPAVEYRSLDGLDHSAVLMAPEALAAAIRQFFEIRK